ncbi:hypothetical protein [Flavobacterium sp.]|uniref:hypothetical protein n=1 Tax=Flavobacterium sp. TaxID=239 RepID=UPI003750E9FF
MDKKYILYFAIIMQLFTSCIFRPEPIETLPNNYKPVYLTRAQLESSIVLENPKTTINSGKIYIKDDVMFVNDVNKGFQIYNYSNPSNPIAIGYINFPGATDLAIRNSILYVNQAVDLVSVNYNVSTNSILVTNRIQNAFPQKLSPQGFNGNGSNDQIIINWIPNN